MLAFSVAWAAGFLHALLIWRGGDLSLGQVVAFMGLLGTLRFPTFISIFSFNLVQLGIAGARRILDLINTETELDENEAGVARSIQGEVVFENVSFGSGAVGNRRCQAHSGFNQHRNGVGRERGRRGPLHSGRSRF
jgi:ATP-binding cassette subfamily B protein